jgi:hypothetical protein
MGEKSGHYGKFISDIPLTKPNTLSDQSIRTYRRFLTGKSPPQLLPGLSTQKTPLPIKKNPQRYKGVPKRRERGPNRVGTFALALNAAELFRIVSRNRYVEKRD